MSKNVRPTLAALLGAASLTVTAPAAAAEARSFVSAGQLSGDAASLRTLIDQRLERAAAEGRHNEIEQLGTLWMTLAQRDQLDRVVARGEGFLNVALRNQRYSEHRSDARTRRVALIDASEIEGVARSHDADLDERIDVERFVNGLESPYQDAVRLSLTGMNHREVAEELGVSHAAARKWAQRLRDRLPDDPFTCS
jgi:hypothetical protein